MMILCRDCRHHERLAQGAVCRAPALMDLTAMVDGEPRAGATADCLDARLHVSMCGVEAKWFEDAGAVEPIPVILPVPPNG
jgi:hypothetical protein